MAWQDERHWTIAQAIEWSKCVGIGEAVALRVLKDKARLTGCPCEWLAAEPRYAGKRRKIRRLHLIDLDLVPVPGRPGDYAAIPKGCRLVERGPEPDPPKPEPLIPVQEALRSDVAVYSGGITWIDAEYDERLGEALRTGQRGVKGWCDLRVASDKVRRMWSAGSEAAEPSAAASSSPTDTIPLKRFAEKSKPGRKPTKQAHVKAAMLARLRLGEKLQDWTQEALAEEFQANRETCRKALKAALSELSEM